ncbi:MAG: hypothetical protein AB1445_04730 [Bacillota bacterium]
MECFRHTFLCHFRRQPTHDELMALLGVPLHKAFGGYPGMEKT